MDKRLLFVLFAVLGSILVLCCCSQVFEAGISGKVVTEVGTESVAVSDVNVFAYTDKGARDSDYEEFKAGTRTRPSEKAGYVATTTTNANGEFVVNKIVWETKKSKYGKTADVNKLYLIFYHDDYDVTTEDATVISDSTNQSNVYVTLKGNKDYTTLNITVFDVSTGKPMTSACTLEYIVGSSEESDTVQITGNATIQISFPKKAEGTSVTFMLSSPGTFWKMTDKDGHPKNVHSESGVKAGTYSVNLYMKPYEFVLPAFNGSVIFGSGVGYDHITINSSPENKNDRVKVWLEYKPVSGDYKPFKETEDADHLTGAREVTFNEHFYYYHGEFSDVGYSNSYTVRINNDDEDDYYDAVDWEKYDTENCKTVTLNLRIAFKADGVTKYREFKYTINGSTDLGAIDLSV